MASKTNTNSASRKNKARCARAGIIAVALLCGVPAAHDVIGTGAFFTDKATVEKSVNVGTMKMKVTDNSLLDPDFGTHNADGTTTGAIKTPGYQGTMTDFVIPTATDAAKPSTGIINPGDDGLYAYTIENTGEKSFDTAKVVKVIITLKDATAKADAAADKDAYVIEGFDAPYVEAKDNVLTLTYAATDSKVLNGSVENDGGDGTSAAFAYNTAFNRNVKNKFQDADIKIVTNVYAKQHRNSVASTLSIDTKTGNITGTGDWTDIANFETAVGSANAAATPAATGIPEDNDAD